MKKRVPALLLACSMALTLTACTPAESPDASPSPSGTGESTPPTATASASNPQSYTPGSYTATASGHNADMTVSVTVDENSITGIEVTQHSESQGVGTAAIDILTDRIVQAQSLAVDNVSGATITSVGLKAAVADCVDQAGGDGEALYDAPYTGEEVKDETFDYDIVVVGGGLAGLSAAATAYQQGLNVAVVEKLDIVGGSSVLTSGSWQSNVTGSPESMETWVDTWLASQEEMVSANYPQEEMIRAVCEASADSIKMLQACGLDTVSFEVPGYGEFTSPNIPDTKKGWKIIEVLNDYLLESGVDIFVNTPATELVAENGAVTGVICETDHGTKTFNAGAVVLATGGYHRSTELMETYIPLAADNYTASAIGNTGDGMVMAQAVGAAMYDEQTVFGGYFVFNPRDVLRGGYAYSDTLSNSLYVSQYGDRRFSEDGHGYSLTTMYNVYHEPTFVWSVMDADLVGQMEIVTDLYTIGADEIIANEDGLYEIVSADTLEELAVEMGVIPTIFMENVERYNELCAQGEDTDMGKDPALLEAIDNGPFYAIKGYAVDRSTVGGIVSNTNAEVCNENGDAIPGLYAAGDVSNRAFYSGAYYGGSGLCVASTRGYTAALNAADYIKNK